MEMYLLGLEIRECSYVRFKAENELWCKCCRHRRVGLLLLIQSSSIKYTRHTASYRRQKCAIACAFNGTGVQCSNSYINEFVADKMT